MVLTHALTILLAVFTISACSSDKSSEVNEIGNENAFTGPHGTGPIQPNSTLIFDVQLIKVEKK